MKSTELHDKGVELIQAAMYNICEDKEMTSAREIHIEGFLKGLNQSLVQITPELAYSTGMVKDPKIPVEKEKTPEDIAREEEEREALMQGEMVASVTEAVMKSVEGNLDAAE